MPATRSLLRNLAVTDVLSLFMPLPAESSPSLGISKISHTPPMTISSEPPRGCLVTGASVMMPKAEAVGELHTALSSASITYGLIPSVPCSILAVLPSSLQDDFADFETRWYNWWQTQQSNFSAWASTCPGQYSGDFGMLASEFLNATSSMDNFTPRVTTCAEFTGSGAEITSTSGTASPGGSTGTGAGGVASETASAGQNGGGSLWSQHRAAVCVVMATFAGIAVIL